MQASQAIPQSEARTWTMAGRWPAVAVVMIGITVLYFVGFSTIPAAHNTAHDTRHSSGFPCH